MQYGPPTHGPSSLYYVPQGHIFKNMYLPQKLHNNSGG
jgi:hypothetical protein